MLNIKQSDHLVKLNIKSCGKFNKFITATLCNSLILPNIIKNNPANTLVSLLQYLMKATVLTESSFIFSPGSLRYADVYRCESGRCHTLHFFLIYFLSFHLSEFSFYINPSVTFSIHHIDPRNFGYTYNFGHKHRKNTSL